MEDAPPNGSKTQEVSPKEARPFSFLLDQEREPMVACRPQFAPKILYPPLGLANSLYLILLRARNVRKKQGVWPGRSVGKKRRLWSRRNV